MHEELAVALDYRSMARPMRMEGGKGEFCEYTKEPVPALKAVLSSMNVTRENIEVKRDRIWRARFVLINWHVRTTWLPRQLQGCRPALRTQKEMGCGSWHSARALAHALRGLTPDRRSVTIRFGKLLTITPVRDGAVPSCRRFPGEHDENEIAAIRSGRSARRWLLWHGCCAVDQILRDRLV